LTIALAVVTASTLLLVAAALAPPPLTAAVAFPPPPAKASGTPRADTTVTTLAQTAGLALPQTPVAVVDLARLVYAPGAGGRHAVPGPCLLAVEAGALTVQLAGSGELLPADGAATSATGLVVLHAGDGMLLPLAAGFAITNAGEEPAVALAAGVVPPGVVGSRFGRVGLARWDEAWSPGAVVQPLAGGWLVDAASRPATIALRRVWVRPDDPVTLTAPGSLDLAVESGVLTLDVRGGLLWQQPPAGPSQAIAPPRAATLLPGDAALIQDEVSVTLRNDGRSPLLVLALTVAPDRADVAAGARWPALRRVTLPQARAQPSRDGPGAPALPPPDDGVDPQRYLAKMMAAQHGSPAATPAASPRAAPPFGASTQPPWDEPDPRAYLTQMTAVQHRQSLPLPGDVGRLQSLVVGATPAAPCHSVVSC
jgi:hypothetical protein